MSACAQCSGRLDVAAVLCEASVCTTCEAKRIRLAADPWATFLRVLRANVRPDGTVHVNDCRESLRGRIEPHKLSSLWSEARRAGLIAHHDWEDSTDKQGRNDHAPARIWSASEQLRKAAA